MKIASFFAVALTKHTTNSSGISGVAQPLRGCDVTKLRMGLFERRFQSCLGRIVCRSCVLSYSYLSKRMTVSINCRVS